MRKMFSEKQIETMIDGKVVEKELVSYDGENFKDADGNTIEVGGGGGMTTDLLWENASPTSTFSSQELSISTQGYSYIYIEFRYKNIIGGDDMFSCVKHLKSDEITTQIRGTYFGIEGLCARAITLRWLGEDKIQVWGGIAGTGTSDDNLKTISQNANSYAIPVAIYGIK